MDDEVDAHVGRRVVATWIKEDGSSLESTVNAIPFDLLSTPLPFGSVIPPGPEPFTLVTKNTVDGLVYGLQTSSQSVAQPIWIHESTFPALAFVLATKRDTRFVHHVRGKGVLAFESGSSVGGNNVFIYKATKKPRDVSAKQAILQVISDNSGSLLGVGAVEVERNTFVLCLCEKELVVLNGLFDAQ